MFHSFLYLYQRVVAGKNPRNGFSVQWPRLVIFPEKNSNDALVELPLGPLMCHGQHKVDGKNPFIHPMGIQITGWHRNSRIKMA